MPLNEHEQKILQEIERGLNAEDPGLVRKVGRFTRLASRRALFAGIVFLVGLVATVGTFAFNQWIALGGFVAMVLGGTAFVHARRAAAGAEDPGPIAGFLGRNRKKQ